MVMLHPRAGWHDSPRIGCRRGARRMWICTSSPCRTIRAAPPAPFG